MIAISIGILFVIFASVYGYGWADVVTFGIGIIVANVPDYFFEKKWDYNRVVPVVVVVFYS